MTDMDHAVPTADFFVKNADEWRQEWDAARQALPPASVQEFERAVILPLRWRKGGPKRNFEGGVVSESGDFLAGHRRALDDSDPPFTARTPYSVDPGAVEDRDEEVVFGGVLFDHIGHLITDSSARLWYPVSTADARKIVFLRSPDFKNWSSVDWKPLMELAGVDLARVEVLERPTRFRKVVVPQEAYYAHGGYRPEWRSFFDAIRSRIRPGSHEKVYLSRSKFVRGNVFNEDLFEQYYRERGFHVAYPEELDFRQKAELISGAEELAATIGTTSHLFLFAKPGAKATVLLRTGSVLKMQLYIGAACEERCSYVEAYRNVLPTYHAAGTYYLFPTPRFQSFLAQSGLPPVDAASLLELGSENRIAPYVDRWFEGFSGNRNFFGGSSLDDFKKRGELAFLASQMQDKAQRTQLVSGIESFVSEGYRIRSELDSTREQLRKAEQAARKAEQAARKAEQAARKAELENNAIRASLSWRITAPLRRLVGLFRGASG